MRRVLLGIFFAAISGCDHDHVNYKDERYRYKGEMIPANKLVVGYDFDVDIDNMVGTFKAKPNCWKVEGVWPKNYESFELYTRFNWLFDDKRNIQFEYDKDMIKWLDSDGSLMVVRGPYRFIKVNGADWQGAASRLGVDLNSCR